VTTAWFVKECVPKITGTENAPTTGPGTAEARESRE
jgi:xanthosine utilization system XapX-like protein